MIVRWFFIAIVILVVVAIGGMGSISRKMQHGASFRQAATTPDCERRREKLDHATIDRTIDPSAYSGFPEVYTQAVTDYIETVVLAIDARPIIRKRFYQSEEKPTSPYRFPDFAKPAYDAEVRVPLVILPRPIVVEAWAASNSARAMGWSIVNKSTPNRTNLFGRTLIFEPGKLSQNPIALPASPHGSEIHAADVYLDQHDATFFLDLGKLVTTPDYDDRGVLSDNSGALHLGEKDGSKLLGEFITVPAYPPNHRLQWAAIRANSEVRRFLGYFLVDGNGAKRAKRFQGETDEPISPHVRPLVCQLHQPKIKQHSELLLPSPFDWPPTSRQYLAKIEECRAHEGWYLDDWFPAQKDACWVFREAEDSKPLQESFLLMPANEMSDRPVFFIALFAETEPKQLIQELAALYKVSPDKALNSPETMARLQSLYEKIRDFPLDK